MQKYFDTIDSMNDDDFVMYMLCSFHGCFTTDFEENKPIFKPVERMTEQERRENKERIFNHYSSLLE